jgi:hypothetical protein
MSKHTSLAHDEHHSLVEVPIHQIFFITCARNLPQGKNMGLPFFLPIKKHWPYNQVTILFTSICQCYRRYFTIESLT